MVALVDCNSFFCAVERAFHPGLRDKPVCVLSSNDGCIVALTPEAKALGLKRGDPLFKVSHIVEQGRVSVFSGNLRLYAAMSQRIVNILRASFARVENYSIDESFCYLDGYDTFHNPTELMREAAERIKLWTDVPVSVGLAPSKTLAKMGSHFAKRHAGYRGVCAIDTEDKRRRALELFPLADVWGIGRRTLDKLTQYGVGSPLELADKSESWVRAHLAKPGLQTWLELNGHPCIDTTEVSRNQSLCTSRSFGQAVDDLPSLRAAVAHFATSCAVKLRAQHAVAGVVRVVLGSNPFRQDQQQYWASDMHAFLTPTSDTMEIAAAAIGLLEKLFRPGILYKKAGVMMEQIVSADGIQQNLFDTIPNRPQRARLMQAIDHINQRYGPGAIHLVAEDDAQGRWHVKSEHRTPNHLTEFSELLTVK